MKEIIDDDGNVVKLPKFRSTNRLIRFMSRYGLRERLPEDREEVFITSKKEDPLTIAINLATYASHIGERLSPRLENIFKTSKAPQAVYSYCCALKVNKLEVPSEMVDLLQGNSGLLYRWACNTESRLPKHLEDSLSDPSTCLKYAKEVLKGRLPSHLETVFFKDVYYATKYAFDVIRGFAPVKLPDDLHNFVVMKSFEHPNDEDIKIYMNASESDPNKIGNSADEV